jgi:hypothetical protein
VKLLSAPPADPLYGVPISILRTRIGLLHSDGSEDPVIMAAFDIAIDILEFYLDRALRYGDYVEVLTHVVANVVPLKAYPLDVAVVVTNEGGSIDFHTEDILGLIHFDGRIKTHELTVSYSGGYIKFPPAIQFAVLAVFDIVWASMTASGGVSVGGGAIRSISNDGATISFDTSSGVSASGVDVISGLPSSIIGILAPFRRRLC